MSRNAEFIRYVKTPLSEDTIQMLFDSHGVTYEKAKLFGDFVKSFLMRSFTTYLDGVDSKIYSVKEQQSNHFTWVWNETVTDFNKENIIFYSDIKVRSYFRIVMSDSFYTFEDKSLDGADVNSMYSLWSSLFEYKGRKTRMDVDGFIELYDLFDEALKGKLGKRLDF